MTRRGNNVIPPDNAARTLRDEFVRWLDAAGNGALAHTFRYRVGRELDDILDIVDDTLTLDCRRLIVSARDMGLPASPSNACYWFFMGVSQQMQLTAATRVQGIFGDRTIGWPQHQERDIQRTLTVLAGWRELAALLTSRALLLTVFTDIEAGNPGRHSREFWLLKGRNAATAWLGRQSW